MCACIKGTEVRKKNNRGRDRQSRTEKGRNKDSCVRKKGIFFLFVLPGKTGKLDIDCRIMFFIPMMFAPNKLLP